MTSMAERGTSWPRIIPLQESLALLRVAAARPDLLELRDSIARVPDWPDDLDVYLLGLALACLADQDLAGVLEGLRDGLERQVQVNRTRLLLDERGALQVARELLGS